MCDELTGTRSRVLWFSNIYYQLWSKDVLYEWTVVVISVTLSIRGENSSWMRCLGVRGTHSWCRRKWPADDVISSTCALWAGSTSVRDTRDPARTLALGWHRRLVSHAYRPHCLLLRAEQVRAVVDQEVKVIYWWRCSTSCNFCTRAMSVRLSGVCRVRVLCRNE